MKRYRKAIVAALTGVVGLVAMFVPQVAEVLGPEQIAAVATVAATAMVWLVPNEEG